MTFLQKVILAFPLLGIDSSPLESTQRRQREYRGHPLSVSRLAPGKGETDTCLER